VLSDGIGGLREHCDSMRGKLDGLSGAIEKKEAGTYSMSRGIDAM
jgi:hypothetical protein